MSFTELDISPEEDRDLSEQDPNGMLPDLIGISSVPQKTTSDILASVRGKIWNPESFFRDMEKTLMWVQSSIPSEKKILWSSLHFREPYLFSQLGTNQFPYFRWDVLDVPENLLDEDLDAPLNIV